MLAGHSRTGKPIYQAWQISASNHELITGPKGFSQQDHRDAIQLLQRLAKNELGEHGPTEFYHQYRRLQEMHQMHVSPSAGAHSPPSSTTARL